MGTTAAIVAAAVATAASAASAGYQASQSGGSGGIGRAPRFKQPPEPMSEQALRHYTARLLAQGAASVPPSLMEWAASGGKAKLDLGNTAFTPGEAVALGLTGKKGEAVPWWAAGQTALTPAQEMFLAQQGHGAIGRTKQINRDVALEKTLSGLEGQPQTPGRQKREAGLQKKLGSSPLASITPGGSK